MSRARRDAIPPPPLPDNPKAVHGATKPSVALVPGVALAHEALAFEDGLKKYEVPFNWRVWPVEALTYVNAALRHIQAYADGEDVAADSGVKHLAHARACLGILLDAEACGTLLDNRPPLGKTAEVQLALQEFKRDRQ